MEATNSLARCSAHPRQNATSRCLSCSADLCPVCVFEVDRKTYCSDCSTEAINAARLAAPVPQRGRTCAFCDHRNDEAAVYCSSCKQSLGMIAGTAPATANANADVARPAQMRPCVQHPEANAIVHCRACGEWSCPTCDFVIGDVHICPSCVERDVPQTLSSSRRNMLIGSMIGGLYSTIALGLLLTGVLSQMLIDAGASADTIIGFIVLFPILFSTGFAWAAIDKRLPNPTVLWVSATWNSILLVIYLVLIVLGLMEG